MTIAVIGGLGVVFLLVLIFIRVPIAVALAVSGLPATPRSTAGIRR